MRRAIAELARRPRAAPSDGQLFGMEVEAEGVTPQDAMDRVWPANTLRNWTIVEDGSLRTGLEFVSLPLTAPALKQAVRNLYNGAFVEGGVHPSVRTGIHIHASCLHLDTEQVLRICQHYALVEPVLFKAVGGKRDENIYCIPWYRAHDTPQQVYAIFGEGKDGELCKYSALHAAPLFKYGTLEYRHAPTFETATEAEAWVDLIAAVHGTWATDYDVLEEWQRLGPSAFAERVLGRDFGWEREFDVLDVDRVCELLRPKKEVAHDGWGIPPMLQTPGSVLVLPSALQPNLTRRPARGRAAPAYLITDDPSPSLNMEEIIRNAEARTLRWFTTATPTLSGTDLPEPVEIPPPEEPVEYEEGPEYEPEWEEDEEYFEDDESEDQP